MNASRDFALGSGANHRATRSVGRESRLVEHMDLASSVSVQHLSVNRAALTRFLAVLIALFVAYLAIGPSRDDRWGYINALCPIVLCLAALWTGYKIIVTNPRTVWTPMPWFALTAAIYFGFGPLVYLFGNEEAISGLDGFWIVRPFDLWRTNLLDTLGLLTITVTFLAADKLLETGRDIEVEARRTPGSGDNPATAAIVFLGVGLPLRYLLVLPYQFGQLNFVLPGSLYILNSLTNLGLFMLAYLGTKRGGLWKAGFWMLFVVEVITNFLCFSKLELILVFIMAALGRFLARRKFTELVLAGMATFCVYILVGPLVSWGRSQITRETGDYNTAPFSLRFAIASRGIELWSRGALEVEGVKQGWWGRLCYSHTQSAAMSLYDSGVVGDSFSVALYAWIPRFLWEDKPVIRLGEDFTILIRGQSGVGTFTGPTTFGEAYWNGGWLVVVLACVYVGFVFAWISRTTLMMLARSEWLLLPCAFLGIMMGLRIDTWFAGTYILGFVLFLVYYFVIRLIAGMTRNDG